MLELGLVNYAMQKVVGRGFVPMITPDLVRESVLEKCGFQPRGTETQVQCGNYFQMSPTDCCCLFALVYWLHIAPNATTAPD